MDFQFLRIEMRQNLDRKTADLWYDEMTQINAFSSMNMNCSCLDLTLDLL